MAIWGGWVVGFILSQRILFDVAFLEIKQIVGNLDHGQLLDCFQNHYQQHRRSKMHAVLDVDCLNQCEYIW